MKSTRQLTYRAGPRALRRLREHGIGREDLGAMIAPASGPKWLVLAGIDRALLDAGWFAPTTTTDGSGASSRLHLVGASAGAWRVAALAARDPGAAHRALQDGYIGQLLPQGITPDEITAKYRTLLGSILGPAEIAHALEHPRLDLGLFTVRLRSRRLASSRTGHALSLAAALLLSPASSRAAEAVAERVLFCTRPEAVRSPFQGQIVRLNENNLLDAVLASGSMPYYFRGVRDPSSASPGLYFDGGLTDYHYRQEGLAPRGRFILFPHYRDRVTPGWFDKKMKWRRPSKEALEDLLLVHPTETFFSRLPDGRVPDRDEFVRFVDAPEERMRRWHEAAKLSDDLGEELLDDLESGRVADLVEPLL